MADWGSGLTGAAGGAAAGSTFGPVGTALGGVIGGIAGLFGGGGESAEERKKREWETAQGMFGRVDENNFQLAGQGYRDHMLRDRVTGLTSRNANAVGPAQMSQFRQNQSNLIGALERQAAGQGPSIAAEQAKAASQRAMQGQLAMARAGGPNAAIAGRTAAMNAAAQQGSVAGQAASARAQEQMNAQAQLANVVGQARSQDRQYNQMDIARAQQNEALRQRMMGMNDQAIAEMYRQQLANAQAGLSGSMGLEQNRSALMRSWFGKQQADNPGVMPGIMSGLAGIGAAYASGSKKKEG